jgi:hypothetical protein
MFRLLPSTPQFACTGYLYRIAQIGGVMGLGTAPFAGHTGMAGKCTDLGGIAQRAYHLVQSLAFHDQAPLSEHFFLFLITYYTSLN